MKKFTIAVFIFFLFYSSTIAGPFGTQMGDTLSKFNNPEEVADNEYLVKELPKTHSLFRDYRLKFRNGGLSCIIASTDIFDSSNYAGLKHASDTYFALKEQLTKKYGKPSRSLLFTIWWDKNLPDDLDNVSLSRMQLPRAHEFISVTYCYKNENAPEYKTNNEDFDAL